MFLLNRNGYGSNFNKLWIDTINKKIKKECTNEYGKNKIDKEILFLKYIVNNKINFKIPKIYIFEHNGYMMEYLQDYVPLFKVYQNFHNKKKDKVKNKIYEELTNLHNHSRIYVSKEEYINNLLIEIEKKLYERYESIKLITNNYKYIKKINNMEYISFEVLLEKIKKDILSKVNDFDKYYFVPIHGDCQFNNILINENDDIIFIDPRGYYGNQNIFGIPEYDFAKVLFALSGYDEFDNSDVNSLTILNDNINIKVNFLDDNILNNNKIPTLLMLSIWLGNASCFINNENKMITSYFISLYLGTLYYKK